ncbi:hypothetical protein PYCC9005_001176 [Savitreella phatthalungensis]
MFSSRILRNDLADKGRRFDQRAINTKRLSKWSRGVQIFSWFAIGFSTVYLIFFVDYDVNGQDHVFKAPQRWRKEQQRKLFGTPIEDELEQQPRKA